MSTWFLTKKPKSYDEKWRITSSNGACLTGCLHAEKNKFIFITLHKTQDQIGQNLIIELNTLKLIEEKTGNIL